MAASSWRVLVVISIAVVGAVFVPKGIDDLCPELRQCSCLNNSDGLDINCRDVSSLAPLQAALVSQFYNVTIHHLYVKNCSVQLVPRQAFVNLTIYTLLLQCPLQEIHQDAFKGSSGLLIVRLYKTKLPIIPTALQTLPDIVQFELEGGKVQKLNNELHNLTSLHSLSLISNEIREITPVAFRDTKGLTNLDLSKNKLQSIRSGVLDGLTLLEELNIEKNQLTTIDGLFQSITPQYISLDGNKLTSLESAFPGNMSEVLQLDLGSNPLRTIPVEVFRGKFANVQILQLSKDNLDDLDSDLFASMTGLVELDLTMNNFFHLPPTIFQPLTNLTRLSLRSNRFLSVTGLLGNMTQLSFLDISYNQLESVDNAFVSLSQLSMLDMSYNRLNKLTGNSFRGLDNLDTLRVQYNRIAYIDDSSFSNLRQLTSIFLDGNSIVDIGHTLHNLPRLVHLSMDFNFIEKLEDDNFVGVPMLSNVSVFRNKLDSIDRTFWNVDGLVSLNISRNMMTTLARDAFPKKMHFLDLKIGYDNPWSCDCRIKWLVEYLRSRNSSLKDDRPTCASPPWQANRNLNDVDPESMMQWPENCPTVCSCACQPWSPELLISVNCSDRSLQKVPQTLPSVVGELLLTNNFLEDIDAVNLSLYRDLRYLYLEDNNLTSITQDFPPKVEVLQLAGNNLTRFPVDTVVHLNLTNVTLSRNPWICDCTALPFKVWIVDNRNIVVDVDEVKCGPESQSVHLMNRTIHLLADTDLCPSSHLPLYVYIIIGVVAFVLCVASLAVVCSRTPVKVWLYSHGISPAKKTEELQGIQQYHAFLSYSIADEGVVTGPLLKGLEDEEPYFKICLQYKHFVSGRSIPENVFDCARSSLRTIVAVSRNFLQKEWQHPEFRAAHMDLVADKSIRRIAIMGGNLPPFDEDMKTYLEGCTIVTWRKKNFWNTLRYAMPRVADRSGAQSETQVIVDSSDSTPLLKEQGSLE